MSVELTPDQLRLEVLKAMGWKFTRTLPSGTRCYIQPGIEPANIIESDIMEYHLPPLTLDLMWQAAQTLDEKQAMEFCFELQKVVCGGVSLVTGPLVVNATAEQRARAFLKVKGIA